MVRWRRRGEAVRTMAAPAAAVALTAACGAAPVNAPATGLGPAASGDATGNEIPAVRASDHATCVLFRSGRVTCWGAWKSLDPVVRPEPVLGLEGVVELSMGQAHACARLAAGTLRCWGWNNMGQVGDGTTHDRDAPTRVTAVERVASVTA